MNKFVFFALLTFLVATCKGESSESPEGGKHWALLVAGSTGYGNYRHQADVCHSYHVVKNHGIPDERIIVMMYDDIAYNDLNPFKGNIINQPDGPNVYPGVPKDYIKSDVTPEVFLKVLTGDEKGVSKLLGRKGKVIKSGPHDRIFVYFADHGAPGIIAFPEETVLHANDLHKAIQHMHSNKLYKQMVFYVEACESGSMFQDILEKDINVYVTTAANPDESSYACFHDEARNTYLGDLYSVNWMMDSDKENLRQESLYHQFKLVKKETNLSHVQEYGDMSMGKLKVADFQGNFTGNSLKFAPAFKYNPNKDAVPSEDVPMEILKKKIASANGFGVDKDMAALRALEKLKYDTEVFFKTVATLASQDWLYEEFLEAPLRFTDFTCYNEGLRLLRKLCPGLKVIQNDYALRRLRVIANMCESTIPQERIWQSIGKVTYESPLCKV